jgi:hypothetical protein
MGEVKFFPRSAKATVKPCPAKVEGPFLGSDASYISCSGVKGHDGPHWHHVEWGEGAGSTPRAGKDNRG